MPEASQADYKRVKTALTERFEPASKWGLYNTELQAQTKQQNEGWADFAEELQCLTENSFSELDAKSLEQMALNYYRIGGKFQWAKVSRFSWLQTQPRKFHC